MNAAVAEAVDLGDLDALVRLIDRLCGLGDWDALVELRDGCRAALQRGRQFWPAAAHAAYRLALEAPGRWAARMLRSDAGRFALGPLTEVAASTHSWAELAPHAPPGPASAMAAHERVVRGEDLRDDGRVDRNVLELPLVLQPWEPAYPLASYGADEAQFPPPPLPAVDPVSLPDTVEVVDDPEGCRSLLEVAAAWTAESNGRAEAVAVRGQATAAIAALGVPTARLGQLSTAEALAQLAWAGASGGAHGRRRGMASGRFTCWWSVAAVAGLLDGWPVEPEALGEAAGTLRWFAWDAGEPVTGWSLRIAVEDRQEGRAWALAASDAA